MFCHIPCDDDHSEAFSSRLKSPITEQRRRSPRQNPHSFSSPFASAANIWNEPLISASRCPGLSFAARMQSAFLSAKFAAIDRLSAHRIDGHHSPTQLQRVQQLGDGCNVVRLALANTRLFDFAGFSGPTQDLATLPLMATTSPAVSLAIESTRFERRLTISAASSPEITRLNTSWEGMPTDSFRSTLNHRRLALQ